MEVPDIDSYVGLAHTLFTLEDLYGIKINNIDGILCLTLDKFKGTTYPAMFEIFNAWHEMAAKFRNGFISEEEYNAWRYNYPKFDTSQNYAKVPSQELSDFIVDAFSEGE